MTKSLVCGACGKRGVERVRTDAGVEVWRCAQCGDVKRRCPRCRHGWLRRLRIRTADAEFISCEECDATWPTIEEIHTRPVDRRTYLRMLGTTETWAVPEVLAEREPAHPKERDE